MPLSSERDLLLPPLDRPRDTGTPFLFGRNNLRGPLFPRPSSSRALRLSPPTGGLFPVVTRRSPFTPHRLVPPTLVLDWDLPGHRRRCLWTGGGEDDTAHGPCVFVVQ